MDLKVNKVLKVPEGYQTPFIKFSLIFPSTQGIYLVKWTKKLNKVLKVPEDYQSSYIKFFLWCLVPHEKFISDEILSWETQVPEG